MSTLISGTLRVRATASLQSDCLAYSQPRRYLRSTFPLSNNAASNRALEEWTERIQAQQRRMHDTTDLNKVRQLALCLPDTTKIGVGSKDAKKHTAESVLALGLGHKVPLGTELVLFNPLLSEHELGSDGTERTFGPPGGLDQRMWASGSFHFEQNNDLKIGDSVNCEVKMEKVEPKSGAKTGNMVLVTRKLLYSNQEGLVSTERRCHVYRKSKPRHERKPLAAASAHSQAPDASEGKTHCEKK